MAGSSGRRRAVGSRPSAAGATETRSFHLLLSWLGRFFSFFSCLSFVLFSHLASVSFLSRWESAGCFSLLLIFHQKMQARAVTSGTLPAMKEAWEETSATPGTRTVPQEDPSVLIPQRDCLQGTCRAESRLWGGERPEPVSTRHGAQRGYLLSRGFTQPSLGTQLQWPLGCSPHRPTRGESGHLRDPGSWGTRGSQWGS